MATITEWSPPGPATGSVDGVDPVPGVMLNEVAPGHFVAME